MDPDRDTEETMPFGEYVRWYLALIFSAVSLGVIAEVIGLPGERVLLVVCGIALICAGLGWPKRLYMVVRNTGWFALLPGIVLRPVLFMLGLVVSVGILLLP